MDLAFVAECMVQRQPDSYSYTPRNTTGALAWMSPGPERALVTAASCWRMQAEAEAGAEVSGTEQPTAQPCHSPANWLALATHWP